MLRTHTKNSSRPPASPHKLEAPGPVPVIEAAEEPDQPFQEGAGDALDPDLRHRMISEAAYYLYQQRGYVDGYELDDWLQAEAQIDHVAIGSPGDDAVGDSESQEPRESRGGWRL